MASIKAGSVLLEVNEPDPAGIVNPDCAASHNSGHKFLLIGDHAGRTVPRRLGGPDGRDWGVSAADMDRHIAWDIGIRALGEALAVRLGVPFVHQRYSRLVIDCNRDPARADAMPAISDGTPVPANADLSETDRAARVSAIHEPYQQAIADHLGPETILVALHSFTPQLLGGEPRPWQAGVLYDGGDTSFALACLAALQDGAGLTIGDNEPYAMNEIDHTIPRHAYPARPYVEFEVRQDLINHPDGVAEWSERLARVLERAAG